MVSAIEHPSVLDTAEFLKEARGEELAVLPVDARGLVERDAALELIDERTLVCSMMAANNEVGTLQPVAELAARCREVGAFFHCDAAQAVGKVPFDVDVLQIDCASVSAHKVYGPKGVGAFYARRRDPRVRPAGKRTVAVKRLTARTRSPF